MKRVGRTVQSLRDNGLDGVRIPLLRCLRPSTRHGGTSHELLNYEMGMHSPRCPRDDGNAVAQSDGAVDVLGGVPRAGRRVCDCVLCRVA